MIDKNMCEHKFTFKREDLFNVDPFFSKKRCELCGETITLERKHKVCVILYVTTMVLLLMLIAFDYNFCKQTYVRRGHVASICLLLVWRYRIQP
ncbi:hypothetical protein D3Z38_04565 [Clostridiales bacterium]|nr:hypothetical protein [Clostridiales bacterium]